MNKYAHLAPVKPAPDFWKYWGCERKRRYPTWYDAVAMIRVLQKLLAVYQCEFCGGFHLTKSRRALNKERGTPTITSAPGTGIKGTKEKYNGKCNTE